MVRPVERGESEPLERLRERIRPFLLRRLKSEVAPELPPRTEVTLYAALSESERSVYDAVRLAARKDVLSKLGKKGGVLAALEAPAPVETGRLSPGARAGAIGGDLFEDRRVDGRARDGVCGRAQSARFLSMDVHARPARAPSESA